MAKQLIAVGTVAGDGTGDPLRSAFIKANSNFSELYAGGGGLLAKTAVAAAPLTGTLTETVLATIPIPAGLIGLNGQLKVTGFWTFIGASSKSMRVRLGGLAGSVMFSLGAATTFLQLKSETLITNRNSAASQYLSSVSGRGTDAIMSAGFAAPTTVNTAVAQDLVFTGQLTVTTETIVLEGYTIEYKA